jgi:hypothetical protein
MHVLKKKKTRHAFLTYARKRWIFNETKDVHSIGEKSFEAIVPLASMILYPQNIDYTNKPIPNSTEKLDGAKAAYKENAICTYITIHPHHMTSKIF